MSQLSVCWKILDREAKDLFVGYTKESTAKQSIPFMITMIIAKYWNNIQREKLFTVCEKNLNDNLFVMCGRRFVINKLYFKLSIIISRHMKVDIYPKLCLMKITDTLIDYVSPKTRILTNSGGYWHCHWAHPDFFNVEVKIHLDKIVIFIDTNMLPSSFLDYEAGLIEYKINKNHNNFWKNGLSVYVEAWDGNIVQIS